MKSIFTLGIREIRHYFYEIEADSLEEAIEKLKNKDYISYELDSAYPIQRDFSDIEDYTPQGWTRK